VATAAGPAAVRGLTRKIVFSAVRLVLIEGLNNGSWWG